MASVASDLSIHGSDFFGMGARQPRGGLNVLSRHLIVGGIAGYALAIVLFLLGQSIWTSLLALSIGGSLTTILHAVASASLSRDNPDDAGANDDADRG